MYTISKLSGRCRLWMQEFNLVLGSSQINLLQNKLSDTSARRSFFSFGDKTKEFKETKIVGFSMEQMYSVVADVGNYRNFVPFCKTSKVFLQKPGFLKADLVVGFPPITESYTSAVTLVKPRLVKADCTEGKLFNHLITEWRFNPGLTSHPQSCVLDFEVSFEFRSSLHSQLSHMFFDQLVKQMENAFILEARRRYGKPTLKTIVLRTRS